MNHSIGILEVLSVARGYEAADAMVKTAAVELAEASPICPGKFLIVVTGAVADVSASVAAGAAAAGDALVDRMELASLHPDVPAALSGNADPPRIEALGILETFTAASCILASDAAVKAAEVALIEIRLSRGMGGKSYCCLTGSVSAVQAAVDAGAAVASSLGQLVARISIPAPHEDLRKFIL